MPLDNLLSPNPYVIIRGESYPVADFTDLSAYHVLILLREGANANIATKSNAAAEIKEVIIPTLPDSIISINANGKYLIHLDATELGRLTNELVIISYQRSFAKLMTMPKTKEIEEEIATTLSILKQLTDFLEPPVSPQTETPSLTTIETEVLPTAISNDGNSEDVQSTPDLLSLLRQKADLESLIQSKNASVQQSVLSDLNDQVE